MNCNMISSGGTTAGTIFKVCVELMALWCARRTVIVPWLEESALEDQMEGTLAPRMRNAQEQGSAPQPVEDSTLTFLRGPAVVTAKISVDPFRCFMTLWKMITFWR